MFRTENIYSLTDFQRNAKHHLFRLKETQQPEILTVQGHAEVVIQDAVAYQKMVDKLESIEAVRKALIAVRNKDILSIEHVFNDLKRELNIK